MLVLISAWNPTKERCQRNTEYLEKTKPTWSRWYPLTCTLTCARVRTHKEFNGIQIYSYYLGLFSFSSTRGSPPTIIHDKQQVSWAFPLWHLPKGKWIIQYLCSYRDRQALPLAERTLAELVSTNWLHSTKHKGGSSLLLSRQISALMQVYFHIQKERVLCEILAISQ